MIMRVVGVWRLPLKDQRVRDSSKAGISCSPYFSVGKLLTIFHSLDQVHLILVRVVGSIDIRVWTENGLRWNPSK